MGRRGTERRMRATKEVIVLRAQTPREGENKNAVEEEKDENA